MREEPIPVINIDTIDGTYIHIDYADSDILFCDDIRELPKPEVLKMQMNVIFICTNGRMQVEVGGHPLTIKQQQLFISHSNFFINNFMVSPDFNGKILLLTDRLIKVLLRQNIEVWNRALYIQKINLFDIDEAGFKHFMIYYDLIRLKFSDNHPLFHREIILSLLQAALLDLCRLLQDSTSEKPQSGFSPSNLLFDRFLNLVSSSPQKHQTVDYYARQLYVTPKYLSSVCKAVSGKTALQWIHEYLVAEIDYYLKNTSLSIKEIAARFDFSNISAFGKYVKQHLGVSPKAYRYQH